MDDITMFAMKERFEWICNLHSIGDVAHDEIWDFIIECMEDAYRWLI